MILYKFEISADEMGIGASKEDVLDENYEPSPEVLEKCKEFINEMCDTLDAYFYEDIVWEQEQLDKYPPMHNDELKSDLCHLDDGQFVWGDYNYAPTSKGMYCHENTFNIKHKKLGGMGTVTFSMYGEFEWPVGSFNMTMDVDRYNDCKSMFEAYPTLWKYASGIEYHDDLYEWDCVERSDILI